jgi:hypothetical protein
MNVWQAFAHNRIALFTFTHLPIAPGLGLGIACAALGRSFKAKIYDPEDDRFYEFDELVNGAKDIIEHYLD